MHALSDLQRLVRRTRNNQVLGKLSLDAIKDAIHSLAELVNLFAGAHQHCERDSAIAMPIALIVAPCIEVEEPCRAVVTAVNLGNISQVHRAAVRPASDRDIVEFLLVLELA